MSEIDDGGPAFPTMHGYVDSFGTIKQTSNGLSLRDYFAGQVLAGFMSAKPMHFNPDQDAEYCYRVADAMLSARRHPSEDTNPKNKD